MRTLEILTQLTTLAAVIEEDVGRCSGVFWDGYDIIIAAAATGAAKRTSSAHDETMVSTKEMVRRFDETKILEYGCYYELHQEFTSLKPST